MQHTKTVVVKVGTSTITEAGFLSKRRMIGIAAQLARLQEKGHQVALVTSASIAAGREALQQMELARSVPEKQMLSAVGQVKLMQAWSELFAIYAIPVGQLLLSKGDFSNRQGYLNARNTLAALLGHRVVPVINENDSVATSEIKFGDNDNLSALVANLIAADLLIMLTDQEGFFTADPRKDPNARLISKVDKIDQALFDQAGATTKTFGMGAGGMITKLEAARLATASGTPAVIASWQTPDVVVRLVEGEALGTFFSAQTTPKESRKRWLLAEKPTGQLVIDAGAEGKLRHEGASLLPVGVTEIKGAFERGSIVQTVTAEGVPIAVGICNYSSREVEEIKGRKSHEIIHLLGYSYGPELIHRDNLALILA